MIYRNLCIAGFVSLFLGGCIGPMKEPVESFAAVGAGETVLVGRVELVPPLSDEETAFRQKMMKPYRQRVFLIADEHMRELHGEPGLGDFTGRIDTHFGKDFFVKAAAKPLYILRGVSWATMNQYDEHKTVYFPGDLRVDIRPGDRAVYIGTIRYHRNEFFQITKTEIIDDYRRVNRTFAKQFGTGHPLRRSLVKKIPRT